MQVGEVTPGRGGASVWTKMPWFRVKVTHPDGVRAGVVGVVGWRAEDAPGC